MTMQTRIDAKAKREQLHFDSLYEFGAWIDRTPETWTSRESKKASSRDWDLGVSYESAVRMAQTGWIEGAEMLQDALTALPLRTPAPDTRTDVYGFRPHVPRFCAGAPDSMIRHTDVAETGAGKVLTLVVQVGAPWFVNAQHIANWGAGVAQYVNQMEMNGTRVELIAAFVSAWDYGGEDKEGFLKPVESAWRSARTVTVKHADQPLDLAVVAFAIGHPAMLRRLNFATLERSTAPESDCYAYSVPTREGDLINAPVGAIILNGMATANKTATTPAKAFEYISKRLSAAIEAQEL